MWLNIRRIFKHFVKGNASLNERGGSETRKNKMQHPWEKLGVALRLNNREKRYTFSNRNFNEIEWLRIDYKSRKYFMEPGT